MELSAIHEAGVSTPKGMAHCIAVDPECCEVGLAAVFAPPKRVLPDRARRAR